MVDDDLLTFEQLKTIQNNEQEQDTLGNLDEQFFNRVKDYLNRKQRIGGHLNDKEYRNARHIVQDILDSRQKKIIRLAFLSTKSDIAVDNLLPEEEVLFDKVKESITEHRKNVEDRLFEDKDTPTPDKEETSKNKDDTTHQTGANQTNNTNKDTSNKNPTEDTKQPKKGSSSIENSEDNQESDSADKTPQEQTNNSDDEEVLFGGETEDTNDTEDRSEDQHETHKDTDTSDEEKQEERATEKNDAENNTVNVKFTADVSEFMGVDLESYGPFEKGDTAVIPDKNAEVLKEQDKAEPQD